MNPKTLNTIKWLARISGTAIFLFIFPFYIGYGAPLPQAEYSFLENLWLIIMPLFLIGLLLGWKFPKIAGYLITIPIIAGFLVALIVWENITPVMATPLISGFLYLIYAYKNK